MRFQNLKGQLVEVDTSSFAKGGQGGIHKLVNSPYNNELVAKIYFDALSLSQGKINDSSVQKVNAKVDQLNRRLQYTVKNNPFTNSPKNIQNAFVWPLDCLFDMQGGFVGFVMPMITGAIDTRKLVGSAKRFPAGFEKFKINQPDSLTKRLIVCYNIAQAMEEFHKSGAYTLVDFKPDNVMILPNGYVRIVDLDSIQIAKKGKILFHAEAFTPDFSPPELIQNKVDIHSQLVDPSLDCFSFAVSAYYILFNVHPFAAMTHKTRKDLHDFEAFVVNGYFAHGKKSKEVKVNPVHNNFLLLDTKIQALFRRALDDGLYNPSLRPSATEWSQALRRTIRQTKNLKISIGGKRQNWTHSTQQPIKVNSLSIAPGGRNRMTIHWHVQNASLVTLNGQSVGDAGSLTYPISDYAFTLAAYDTTGSMVSKKVKADFSRLKIRQFDYEIIDNGLQFKWESTSAQARINGKLVPLKGSAKMPLKKGKYTLEVSDSKGFLKSADIQVGCLSKIKYFRPVITRSQAFLEWEVFNARSLSINGKSLPTSLKKIQVPLVSKSYKLVVTDQIGNKADQVVFVQLAPLINRFEITEYNNYALINWDVLHAKYCELNGEFVPLKGSRKVPLYKKNYILKLFEECGKEHTQIRNFKPRETQLSLSATGKIKNFSKSIIAPKNRLTKISGSIRADNIQKLRSKGNQKLKIISDKLGKNFFSLGLKKD